MAGLAAFILASMASAGICVRYVAFVDQQHRAQENTVLSAATSGVTSVAFSPDGKLLAGAYADGAIWLWDLATGRARGPALRVGAGFQAGVTSVAFSPDGKLLAGAYADGAVRLWDPATGQAASSALAAGPGPSGSANAVAFSPDGKLLAGAYADGAVRLWDPATGQAASSALQIGPGSQNGVKEVAFSPDGKLLAYAAGDAVAVRVWSGANDQNGGLDSGSWLIITAFVIAVAVSASAVIITARHVHPASRRLN